MRDVLLVVLALFLSGCGTLNLARGNAIEQTKNAVKEIVRTSQMTDKGREAATDALSRLHVLGVDFPPPKAEIKRLSNEDNHLFNVHAGLAQAAADRRKARDEVLEPLKDAWEWTKFAIRWGPWVVILFGLGWIWIWIRREFWKRDVVIVKHVAATVPDKERRRRIAGGSPIGRAFDRIKSWYAAPAVDGDETGPIDAHRRTESTGDVSEGSERN